MNWKRSVVFCWTFLSKKTGLVTVKKQDLKFDPVESSVEIIGQVEDILEMGKEFRQLEERTLIKVIHLDNAKMKILMRQAIRPVWQHLRESLMIDFQHVSDGMRIIGIDQSSLTEAECILKELAEPRYSKIAHSLAEPFYQHGKRSWRNMEMSWNVSVDWSASDDEPPYVLVCHGLQEKVEKWIDLITSEIESFFKAKKLIQRNDNDLTYLQKNRGRIALRRLLKDLRVGWNLQENGIRLCAKEERSLCEAAALLKRQRRCMS